MIDATIVIVSLLLAGLLGFAAHRASLCTVKAVAEVVSTRRAHMLISFVKTALWVVAITFALAWWLPERVMPATTWAFSGAALAGGFVFGVGAAINGGCAISTISKLGSGRLAMLMTIAGLALGIVAFLELARDMALPAPVPGTTLYRPFEAWSGLLIALLALWLLWETLRLWRRRPVGLGARRLVLADSYRLSTAAALLGLANGLIYAFLGPWAYTGTIGHAAAGMLGDAALPALLLWGLFAAVVAGAVLSARQRGTFRLEWRPDVTWGRYLSGGFLMGFGAAMIPGGNDVLLLHAIPGFSAHALPAFGAMLLGIGLVIVMMRLVTGRSMRVDCSGDVCVS